MYYLVTVVVYAAVDVMSCLGLSLQFGVGGVTNFGFIIFQAVGAYAAAILSLPSDSANGGFQTYIGGLHLPFPVPLIGAALAGAALAVPFTLLVGRRLRGDFAAVGLLVAAVLMNLLVMNYKPLLNGDAGVALAPAPLRSDVMTTASLGYQWGFAIAAVVVAAGVYWFVRHITESPYGRTLRAMRDNDKVADSLGKDLRSLRTGVLLLGGAIAGLSGGVLVSFISVWSPAAWTYAETIVLFAAVIIGGRGNHLGAVLGAIIVPVGFEESTRLIANSNPSLPPNLLPSLQWVAIGLLVALFLWFRPQGVLPERKRVIALPGSAAEAGRPSARIPVSAPPAPGPVPITSAGLIPMTTAGSVGPAAAIPAAPAPAPQPVAPAAVTPETLAATPAHDIVLQAIDVSRDFGGVHAVSHVSLAVRRGTLTGLIGPNGAGKSTLLALLAGTDNVSAGHIVYHGQDITRVPAYRRARLGLVRTFQLASEFKRLTVLENLLSATPGNRGDSFRGALAGHRYWGADEASAIAKAAGILTRFGLEPLANEYAGDLSGGQRRLVEIMRALMTDPQMLLLDEPMAGVHPELARQIGGALVELCRDGMTILMVEHELAIMDEFCDPVIVMAEGSVLAEGTMTELRDRTEVVEAYLVG
ncbi:MAG TPA: branched-chain amino acid ABC transporter ATP-binding protein/permease [Streptosporangiaceae bacterium]|nr:branched-chain amino acid ABC transporter ATP-binding protein/permease [Streptosporangiaceae bacterium]